ncbi:MAG: hypothetical protein J7556_14865 [Acidovorax sp.]|nr:hypothetical protein [Acidovorax sp.]
MTRFELAEYLGWPVAKVGTTIASTRWLLPGQVFRIVRYVAVTGRRGRDIAVYAAQPGRDASRKPADQTERRRQVQARYRENHRARINARARAQKARDGVPLVLNPWLQLAAPELRATMTRHT